MFPVRHPCTGGSRPARQERPRAVTRLNDRYARGIRIHMYIHVLYIYIYIYIYIFIYAYTYIFIYVLAGCRPYHHPPEVFTAVHGGAFPLRRWFSGEIVTLEAGQIVHLWLLMVGSCGLCTCGLLTKSLHSTGVPHLQENAAPWDPTVGLCLGS